MKIPLRINSTPSNTNNTQHTSTWDCTFLPNSLARNLYIIKPLLNQLLLNACAEIYERATAGIDFAPFTSSTFCKNHLTSKAVWETLPPNPGKFNYSKLLYDEKNFRYQHLNPILVMIKEHGMILASHTAKYPPYSVNPGNTNPTEWTNIIIPITKIQSSYTV